MRWLSTLEINYTEPLTLSQEALQCLIKLHFSISNNEEMTSSRIPISISMGFSRL